MIGDLEQEYRAVLRRYPRRWRLQHEDALLGILLDQADAEARTRMTASERRRLVRHGLGLRLAPVLLLALLVLAAVAALLLGDLLVARTGLDSRMIYAPPPLLPVPVGSGWTPPFILQFSGGALYLIDSTVLAAAAIGAARLIRRMRRA